MFHYVYLVTSKGQFYIGVRSVKKHPYADFAYFGSGVWSLFRLDKSKARKQVLSIHRSRASAEMEETRLILRYGKRASCMNVKFAKRYVRYV